MTHGDRDGEDDWGGPTDWQRPAQPPPPADAGWTQPPVDPPHQGYGNAPGHGGQPHYGPPPAYQPAGPPQHPQGWPVAPPPNYMVPALLLTLWCVPTGIAAIHYSGQVGARHKVGDHPGALAASAKARMWCGISLVAGIVFWGLYVIGSSSGY